jgi:hypothetical protein
MKNVVWRTLPLLLLGAVLAGCASAGQRAAHNEERCVARGFQPKTDAFSDCLVRLDSEREQRMDARRNELLEKSSSPLSPNTH